METDDQPLTADTHIEVLPTTRAADLAFKAIMAHKSEGTGDNTNEIDILGSIMRKKAIATTTSSPLSRLLGLQSTRLSFRG